MELCSESVKIVIFDSTVGGLTELRQIGQVELPENHLSMQLRWKTWRQPGRNLVLSPSASSARQTAHSMPSLNAAELKTLIGSDLSTPESMAPAPATEEGKRKRAGELARMGLAPK